MGAKLRKYVSQHHLALLALFVALGGTSYAVVGKDQVTSRSVKNNSLTGKDINESKLDVPIGRFDRADGACETATTSTCAAVDLRTRAPARAFVSAGGQTQGGGASPSCSLRAGGTEISSAEFLFSGGESFTLTGIAPRASGNRTYRLVCGAPGIGTQIGGAHIEVVSLSRR